MPQTSYYDVLEGTGNPQQQIAALNWLQQHGIKLPRDVYISASAVHSGSLAVLEWVRQRATAWDDNTAMLGAAQWWFKDTAQWMQVLQYLDECKTEPWAPETQEAVMGWAGVCGFLNILTYARETLHFAWPTEPETAIWRADGHCWPKPP